MNKSKIIFSVYLLFTVLICSACNIDYGTIYGYITDDSGLGIENAIISSTSDIGTMSDSDGFYTMRHPAGRVQLIVKAGGYGTYNTYFNLDNFGNVKKDITLYDDSGASPPELGGTIDGEVREGVTVTLSGDASNVTTSDASGNYSFTDVEQGNYTITPSLTEYVFYPASQSVTVSDAYETRVDFVSAGTGIIYGYIKDGSTALGIEGALISSNAGAKVLSAQGGDYVMMHMSGSFQLTVSADGYYTQTYGFDLFTGEILLMNVFLNPVFSDPDCFLEDLFLPSSREVETLRSFRDNVLKNNPVGREIIEQYYNLSPLLKELIEDNYLLKINMKLLISGIVPIIEETLK